MRQPETRARDEWPPFHSPPIFLPIKQFLYICIGT